ncbi:MAG TPA: hypothetical protein DDY86_04625, partial [Syntrophaceae bacterium]|nr:hypothetical protein [Syntrophaceae bacterium]
MVKGNRRVGNRISFSCDADDASRPPFYKPFQEMVGSADYAPAGLDADRSYNEMQCVLPLLPEVATSLHESKALLWCVLKRYSQFHSVFNDFAFLD